MHAEQEKSEYRRSYTQRCRRGVGVRRVLFVTYNLYVRPRQRVTKPMNAFACETVQTKRRKAIYEFFAGGGGSLR